MSIVPLRCPAASSSVSRLRRRLPTGLASADEPTAELDTQMSAQIMNVFRTIMKTEQVTICMTTHDPTILEVADHVYEMVDGTFI